MSCFLYCIFGAKGPAVPKDLEGVGGAPISVVTHRGLGAAVSTVAQAAFPRDFAAVRAHGRVVAAFHQDRTVVPMRFGCLLEHEDRVARLLKEGAGKYRGLLQELHGCTEMGIRLLLPPGNRASGDTLPAPGRLPPAGQGAALGSSGAAYLQTRKLSYDQQDREAETHRQITGRCLDHFRGIFKKFRIETNYSGWPLLSLYFLVPQSSLAAFCLAFRTLSPAPGAKVLLSGPWPPYSFVTEAPAPLPESAREP